ncbi:MAG: phosphate transport system permease protein, partial [Gammaproteobacteria bacterium]|nr:phosphate transport system permease protein [Gammaproteobacteria bacterium]
MAIIDPRHAAKQLIYERIFRAGTLAAAILVLLILGGVAISLLRGTWPAARHFGFSFITREIWNP